MTEVTLRPHAYVLAVHDLPASAAYLIDVLGFTVDWVNGADWCTVVRGEVRLMMGRCPEALSPADLGDHSYFGFFATNDVDALYAEFSARGAIIRAAPASKPWGWREMVVATPEGHRMMFAQRV
ncbi:VOC family protein [Glacieibacterium megasporae]|uniref:VOC family protein n=1 Tax=Glacieibacterium megasporae TaxID=2835787 RepID=UPI001C1DD00E|nr:VOC family protein [Polymorphobacter megasporae]UAJ11617.1 VOC family protein [Polymorphobacter megasporae]